MTQSEKLARDSAPTVCAVDFDDTLIQGNLGKAVAEERMKQLHQKKGNFPEELFINISFKNRVDRLEDDDLKQRFSNALDELSQAFSKNIDEFIQAAKTYFYAAKEVNSKLKENTGGLHFGPLIEAHVFKGMTEEELKDLTAKTISKNPQIVERNTVVGELIGSFEEILIHITSGSPEIIVREAARILRIPADRITGTTLKVTDGTFTGSIERPNVYENKTRTVREQNSDTPYIAIANKNRQDQDLLKNATRAWVVGTDCVDIYYSQEQQ